MSIPSIKVGQGNWGIKAGNLLGYANTEKKFSPVEFTSSRALNTATRVNPSGNIEIVNANIPRIDYFGGQSSLLVEPSGRNFSPDGDNMSSFSTFAGGGAPQPSVTSTTSLSGQNNAALVAGGSGSTGNWGIFRLIPLGISSGQTVTYSVFAKAGTNNFIHLTHSNVVGTGGNSAYFDLFNGTTPTANARIENCGNGWYRCIMPPFTFTSTPDGSYNIGHRLTENTTTNTWSTSYFGKSAIFYGAQLEIGSVATSYIPTLSTVPVTRNADVISVTGVAGLIGQTEGTIYAEVDIRNVGLGEGSIVTLFQANNNYIEILRSTSNRIQGVIVDSAGSTVLTTTTNFITANSVYKIALGYKSGEFALYINGTQIATSSAARTIGGLTTVRLGSFNTAIVFNDRIRAVELYQTRLPNTTTDGSPSLQSITTL